MSRVCPDPHRPQIDAHKCLVRAWLWHLLVNYANGLIGSLDVFLVHGHCFVSRHRSQLRLQQVPGVYCFFSLHNNSVETFCVPANVMRMRSTFMASREAAGFGCEAAMPQEVAPMKALNLIEIRMQQLVELKHWTLEPWRIPACQAQSPSASLIHPNMAGKSPDTKIHFGTSLPSAAAACCLPPCIKDLSLIPPPASVVCRRAKSPLHTFAQGSVLMLYLHRRAWLGVAGNALISQQQWVSMQPWDESRSLERQPPS